MGCRNRLPRFWKTLETLTLPGVPGPRLGRGAEINFRKARLEGTGIRVRQSASMKRPTMRTDWARFSLLNRFCRTVTQISRPFVCSCDILAAREAFAADDDPEVRLSGPFVPDPARPPRSRSAPARKRPGRSSAARKFCLSSSWCLKGQADRKHGAAARLALDRNISFVLLNDVVGDEKARAEAHP